MSCQKSCSTSSASQAGIALLVLLVASVACGQLGYSDRVLQRVPSPDRQIVAVCQEVPEFDGPGYDVRLEDASGRIRARLYQGLDDDQCNEIVWSADGRSLAVLTRYIARVRVVDVPGAVSALQAAGRRQFLAVSSFSSATALKRGWDLRFVAPGAVEVTVCPYEWEQYKRTGQFRCTGAEQTERVAAPPRVEAGPT